MRGASFGHRGRSPISDRPHPRPKTILVYYPLAPRTGATAAISWTDTRRATPISCNSCVRSKKSVMRLFKTMPIVDQQVEEICRKHGVRLYKYANVGNHLHLLIKIANRRRWAAFIRELTGRIAQLVRSAIQFSGEFWDQRPFTRIVRSWRRGFKTVKEYIELNWLEARGNISRQDSRMLRRLHALLNPSG